MRGDVRANAGLGRLTAVVIKMVTSHTPHKKLGLGGTSDLCTASIALPAHY